MLLLTSCSTDLPKSEVKIEKGVLDLSTYSFSVNPYISLEGDWKFFYQELPPIQEETTSANFLNLPNHWNETRYKGNALGGQGTGTFQLKIILPKTSEFPPLALLTSEQDTSHAIYLDGQYLGGAGTVGLKEENTIPEVKSSLILLPIPPKTKEVTLDLVVSNFSHRKGGPWNDVLLASYDKAQEKLTARKMNETMISSILLFVGIFFLAYYLFERKSSHAFGIFSFSLIVLLRNLTTGERIILDVVSLPYSIILRLEYISWFWAAPILTRYFQSLFPFDFPSNIAKYFYRISIALTFFLLLPSVYFTETASIYPIVFVSNGIFILYGLYKTFQNRRIDSYYLLGGTFVLLIGALNDTLHAESIIHTHYIGPLTVVIFVFSQVFTFGNAIKSNISQTKDLAKNLISINESYSRFVPRQFLNFLGKADIREIELGEQVQKKMTILFADIRSFTEFSEQLSPKENFDFLNAYLQRVGPIIRHNQGFIDKFIGDAIMALFPNHPDDAIRAAVQMQVEIRDYNEHRAKSNYQPIKVGIGIHTGSLILGILGEHERLEGTVISDAVNLASRIEGVTKLFGAEIVISADTFIEASESLGFHYRLLDRVAIKGKSESVYVVEVLNGYEEEKLAALVDKKEDYTFALEAYRRHAYDEAHELFLEILNAIPQDNVSRVFLADCERHLAKDKIDI